ncbi:Predicted oxidoreductase [Paracoccus alcaliphilus]|uniref:Predicted oxidoreductase n=1 Tax=Paracoccus alcaliphilus TaxID=34002 RepID=A0A1H8IVR9_9RHOB|nr:aldo/keto reductase [Paracoccus alcaliphilus]WCR18311.1 aldo/keto reductase [Paracoccus alcaliphilus]SEN72541.1 Predicted oxidoreductase [Paracoccus alcaliphilus]
MKRVKLGGSDVEVSEICLGTMTYGNQTDQADAHAQMDRALETGITFMDCAEMYPVNPVTAESAGRSEEFIGSWLARTGHRDRVELATKITGPGQVLRDGKPFDGKAVTQAIEDSLRRLCTDRIDLYQMHWPVRGTYAFRRNWDYDPSGQDRQQTLDHMADVLGALEAARKAGKIRAVGLSNDTAWGLTRWIDVAERMGAPRMAAIQNEYSLVHRLYDTDLAEAAVNEDVTLLSYSPLAAGMLTGKYSGGAMPEGSRAAVDVAHGGQGNLGGRKTPRGIEAVEAYIDLAREHGWDIVHLAIGWQLTRPFKVVPIIGATSLQQLEHLIAGLGRVPDDALCEAIGQMHRQYALPY